jgi:hypothetical protein
MSPVLGRDGPSCGIIALIASVCRLALGAPVPGRRRSGEGLSKYEHN